MTETSLSPRAVLDLLQDSMVSADPSDPTLTVRGIIARYRFSQAAIERNAPAIHILLLELPEPFQLPYEEGRSEGGWSFLNACEDRHGRQWTGEHRIVEMLACLGLAAGWAKWTAPRFMWPSLPGGMPYLTVLTERAIPAAIHD